MFCSSELDIMNLFHNEFRVIKGRLLIKKIMLYHKNAASLSYRTRVATSVMLGEDCNRVIILSSSRST